MADEGMPQRSSARGSGALALLIPLINHLVNRNLPERQAAFREAQTAERGQQFEEDVGVPYEGGMMKSRAVVDPEFEARTAMLGLFDKEKERATGEPALPLHMRGDPRVQTQFVTPADVAGVMPEGVEQTVTTPGGGQMTLTGQAGVAEEPAPTPRSFEEAQTAIIWNNYLSGQVDEETTVKLLTQTTGKPLTEVDKLKMRRTKQLMSQTELQMEALERELAELEYDKGVAMIKAQFPVASAMGGLFPENAEKRLVALQLFATIVKAGYEQVEAANMAMRAAQEEKPKVNARTGEVGYWIEALKRPIPVTTPPSEPAEKEGE